MDGATASHKRVHPPWYTSAAVSQIAEYKFRSIPTSRNTLYTLESIIWYGYCRTSLAFQDKFVLPCYRATRVFWILNTAAGAAGRSCFVEASLDQG
eukprot:2244437-Rhodomonas_salina.2